MRFKIKNSDTQFRDKRDGKVYPVDHYEDGYLLIHRTDCGPDGQYWKLYDDGRTESLFYELYERP